jgi:RecB family exonuclease
LTFPATAQEHRLRTLLSDADVRSGMAAATDPTLAAGSMVMAARRGDRFTRFDGNLAGLAVPSPVSGPVSPTSLERWAVCPSAYLMKDVLRVQTVENPEDELRITPLDRGNLVHQVFEQFILEVLARPVDEQPGPDDPWSPTDQARIAAIGAKLCDDYERRGRTGRPIFWRRDRRAVLADLQRFLTLDSAHRHQHRTRPYAAELAFGTRGSTMPTVPIRLADGRVVHFKGKADRVDVSDDGIVHVVDYKTGSSTQFKALTRDDPDLRGRKLQLPVYAVAARLSAEDPDAPVQAEYWFTSAKGKFERFGYPVTASVLDHVGRTLATLVIGIEAGIFPPHPTATSTSWVDCDYCDPDALGVVELRRHWERKRADPALAPYVDLAEPPELEVATGD